VQAYPVLAIGSATGFTEEYFGSEAASMSGAVPLRSGRPQGTSTCSGSAAVKLGAASQPRDFQLLRPYRRLGRFELCTTEYYRSGVC